MWETIIKNLTCKVSVPLRDKLEEKGIRTGGCSRKESSRMLPSGNYRKKICALVMAAVMVGTSVDLQNVRIHANTEEAEVTTEAAIEAEQTEQVESVLPEEIVVEEETETEAVEEQKQVFTKKVTGGKVIVTADPGVFPADATVEVKEIKGQKKLDKIQQAIAEDGTVSQDTYAYDITVYDGQGNEIQPDTKKGQVKVAFTAVDMDIEATQEIQVYHVSDDFKEAEQVPANTAGEKEQVEICAEHFSIYVVTVGQTKLRYYENADGTQGYYLIYTADDLALFRNIINGTATGAKILAEKENGTQTEKLASDLSQNAVLMNDIDLTGTEFTAWTPIGSKTNPYKATFDGNGKTVTFKKAAVTGGKISDVNVGLFGYAEGATIQNLRVDGTMKIIGVNCTVENSITIGSILGRGNSVSIKNCESSCTIDVSDSGANSVDKKLRAGGMVGFTYDDSTGSSQITRCSNSGTINVESKLGLSDARVGGIVGEMGKATTAGSSQLIDKCTNAGKITSTVGSGIGGIVGAAQVQEVRNCSNTGDVDANGRDNVGGLVGELKGIVANSHNTGDVTGSGKIGGIVGKFADSKCTVKGVYNSGKIKGSNNSVGGIIGYLRGGTILYAFNGTNSKDEVYVQANEAVGGIAGGTTDTSEDSIILRFCYNTAYVNVTSRYFSGIIGSICSNNKTTQFQYCWNIGTLKKNGTSQSPSSNQGSGDPYCGKIIGRDQHNYTSNSPVTITDCTNNATTNINSITNMITKFEAIETTNFDNEGIYIARTIGDTFDAGKVGFSSRDLVNSLATGSIPTGDNPYYTKTEENGVDVYRVYGRGKELKISGSADATTVQWNDNNTYTDVPDNTRANALSSLNMSSSNTKLYIYGGGEGVDYDKSSSITMEGGTVTGIFGGGQAGAIGDVNINISGGTVTENVCGTGLNADAKNVTISINGGKVQGNVSGTGSKTDADSVGISITGETTTVNGNVHLHGDGSTKSYDENCTITIDDATVGNEIKGTKIIVKNGATVSGDISGATITTTSDSNNNIIKGNIDVSGKVDLAKTTVGENELEKNKNIVAGGVVSIDNSTVTGKISAEGKEATINNNSSVKDITAGTIDMQSSTAVVGGTLEATGNISVDGGKVSGSVSATGDVTFINGVDGSAATADKIIKGATVTITGSGTINQKIEADTKFTGEGIKIGKDANDTDIITSKEVTLTKATVNGNITGVSGTTAVTLGDDTDTNVVTVNGSITGKDTTAVISVGKSCVITGNIGTCKDVTLDNSSKVTGNIQASESIKTKDGVTSVEVGSGGSNELSAKTVIMQNATIKGNIKANNVSLGGTANTVEGNITATTVKLNGETDTITGDVKAKDVNTTEKTDIQGSNGVDATGTVNLAGTTTVTGDVKGNANTIKMKDTTTVNGDVLGKNITMQGTTKVKKNVTGDTITMQNTTEVDGDVTGNTVKMQDTTTVKGDIKGKNPSTSQITSTLTVQGKLTLGKDSKGVQLGTFQEGYMKVNGALDPATKIILIPSDTNASNQVLVSAIDRDYITTDNFTLKVDSGLVLEKSLNKIKTARYPVDGVCVTATHNVGSGAYNSIPTYHPVNINITLDGAPYSAQTVELKSNTNPVATKVLAETYNNKGNYIYTMPEDNTTQYQIWVDGENTGRTVQFDQECTVDLKYITAKVTYQRKTSGGTTKNQDVNQVILSDSTNKYTMQKSGTGTYTYRMLEDTSTTYKVLVDGKDSGSTITFDATKNEVTITEYEIVVRINVNGDNKTGQSVRLQEKNGTNPYTMKDIGEGKYSYNVGIVDANKEFEVIRNWSDTNVFVTLSESGIKTLNYYTMKYDSNGATAGSAPSSNIEYLDGTEVTLDMPQGTLKKDNYQFVGWNTADKKDGEIWADSVEISSSNQMVYAIWKANSSYEARWEIAGQTYYGTFCEAMDARKNSIAGVTVFVQQNVSFATGDEIRANDIVVVESGKTLTLPSGVTVPNNGSIIVNAGGKLDIQGEFTNCNNLLNNGTVTVGSSGKIENATNGEIVNKGIFTVDNGGSVSNKGSFINEVNGKVNIGGTIDGSMSNTNSFVNKGQVNIGENGVLDNSGTLSNESTGTIVVEGTLNNKKPGTLLNDGTITIKGNGKLNNESTIVNTGIIDGEGEIHNSGTILNEGGRIEGNLTVDNNNGQIIGGTVGNDVEINGGVVEVDSANSEKLFGTRVDEESGVVTKGGSVDFTDLDVIQENSDRLADYEGIKGELDQVLGEGNYILEEKIKYGYVVIQLKNDLELKNTLSFTVSNAVNILFDANGHNMECIGTDAEGNGLTTLQIFAKQGGPIPLVEDPDHSNTEYAKGREFRMEGHGVFRGAAGTTGKGGTAVEVHDNAQLTIGQYITLIGGKGGVKDDVGQDGGIGLFVNTSGLVIINGKVYGGEGGSTINGPAGNGGTGLVIGEGIDADIQTDINGSITGGKGGNSINGKPGNGGAGLDNKSDTPVDLIGSITGGEGGSNEKGEVGDFGNAKTDNSSLIFKIKYTLSSVELDGAADTEFNPSENPPKILHAKFKLSDSIVGDGVTLPGYVQLKVDGRIIRYGSLESESQLEGALADLPNQSNLVNKAVYEKNSGQFFFRSDVTDGNSEKSLSGIEVICNLSESIEETRNMWKEVIKNNYDSTKASIEGLPNLSAEEKEDYVNQLTEKYETGVAVMERVTDSLSHIDTIAYTTIGELKEIWNAANEKDAENLAKAKVDAKKEIASAAEEAKKTIDSLTDLTEEEKKEKKNAIDAASDTAKEEIDQKTTIEQVEQVTEDKQDAIQSVVEEAKAKDLQNAKDKAIEEMENKANASKEEISAKENLTEEEKKGYLTEIDKALEKAKEDIKNATDKEGITNSVNDAKETIDAQVTEAGEKDQGNLDAAKEEAKKEIDAAAEEAKKTIDSLTDLTEEEKAEKKEAIDAASDAAKEEIDQKTTIEQVEQVTKDKQDAIQSVVEEAKAEDLQNAKDKAIEELEKKGDDAKDNIFNKENLTEEEKNNYKDAIDQAVEDAKEQIQNATDKESVSGIVSDITDTIEEQVTEAETIEQERQEANKPGKPSTQPTQLPGGNPTPTPGGQEPPTQAPEEGPTATPGEQGPPTQVPEEGPTATPEVQGPPTQEPAEEPTATPEVQGPPTQEPAEEPTATPEVQGPHTLVPSAIPTATPEVQGPPAPPTEQNPSGETEADGLSEEEMALLARTRALSDVADSILNGDTDSEDPEGSVFAQLYPKAVGQAKKVKLSWKQLEEADGYVIYGSACGAPMEELTRVEDDAKSWTHKKLAKGKYYKYIVVAYVEIGEQERALSCSVSVHAATKGGKTGNPKKVSVKKKLSLKKGKKKKLKIKVKKTSKKMKTHIALTRFEMDKTGIITVNKKGKVKAKKKGKCILYVYAQNGIYTKVKVTVK